MASSKRGYFYWTVFSVLVFFFIYFLNYRIIFIIDIAQAVLLTKIDNLCDDVKKDTSYACTSPEVLECVGKVATLLGLPRNNVFPLKNYENETELDDKMSILALVALRQMLAFSEDASKARLERIEAENAQLWLSRIVQSQCSIF